MKYDIKYIREVFNNIRYEALGDIDKKKYDQLKVLLKDDDLFLGIDYNMAINILIFLGIQKDELISCYSDLTSFENRSKSFKI